MTIGGQDITAEQLASTLVSICSSYNHSHFASWSLEMSGRTTTDEAVDTLRGYVLCETLARELDMELPACTTVYQTGYRGLTAQGQTWTEEHRLLENQIVKAQGSLPADRLPGDGGDPEWPRHSHGGRRGTPAAGRTPPGTAADDPVGGERGDQMSVYITGDTHGGFQRFGSKYFPQQKTWVVRIM